MPFPSLVDPVVGTVITAAWEIANPLAAVRWLRQLMGNTDPPGSSYVVVSTSTSSGAWARVPADALAPGVAVANLGYTPVNKAGDSGIGSLSAVGFHAGVAGLISDSGVQAAGQIVGGWYTGGSLVTGGFLSVQGLSAGLSGIACAGPIVATGAIVGQAGIQAGFFAGGSTSSGGTVNVQGLQTGASGVAAGGPITCTSIAPTVSYGGGTTAAGTPSMQGLVVGANGISNAGPYAGGSTGTGDVGVRGLSVGDHGIASAAIITIAGQQVYWPGNPPPAAVSVPSGAVVGFDDLITNLPSGWTRFTAADGRLLVGDGTTFSQTFTRNTNYGAAWGHAHATTWASHTHSGSSLSISGTTGGPSATGGTASGTPPPSFGTDTHTHGSGSLDVGGNTDAAGGGGSSTDTWLPPMRAIFWIKKT